MSYYDHATPMAHRLGPWADATARQPTMAEREILRHQDMGNPAIRRPAPGVFGRVWQYLKRPQVQLTRCDEPL